MPLACGCVLIDGEFTGLFLPGFDLAMLHTLVGRVPQHSTGTAPRRARERIHDHRVFSVTVTENTR